MIDTAFSYKTNLKYAKNNADCIKLRMHITMTAIIPIWNVVSLLDFPSKACCCDFSHMNINK